MDNDRGKDSVFVQALRILFDQMTDTILIKQNES